jgi:hypothetical protein
VAKREWTGLSEGQVAVRLGKLLGVRFTEEAVGLGGLTGRMADAGDDAWVALVLEQKHAHPVENVLQFWPRLERNRTRLVLVHAIAPDARRKVGPTAELTRWLGGLMERAIPGRFTYCRVELGTPAEAAQLEAAAAAVGELRLPHIKAGPAAGL